MCPDFFNTLYTFDFSEKKYSSLGIKASLPDLSPQEQEAKDYIAKSITNNRKMLEYLQNYQQQQIITLLDLDIKQ